MINKNFQFESDGYIYMTLIGFNYMNMNIADISMLPDALRSKVETTLDNSAVIHDDLNVYWDFAHHIQATFTVTSEGKTYLFDSTNNVTPLREVDAVSMPVQISTPKPEKPEPVSIPEEPEPVSAPEESEFMPVPEEPKPVPVVEEEEPEVSVDVNVELWESRFNNLDLAMNQLILGMQNFDAVIVEATKESKSKSEHERTQVSADDSVFHRRIDCYSLEAIDMDEVESKGDAFCMLHNWKVVDNIFMIDDVVSVCRCIHSDALGLNKTIPYSEIAAYAE